MKSLKKNIVFNVIYDVCNVLFPLVTSIYVSRIILPEGIGSVSYAQNIASYFVSLAALGIPAYGIREIAKVRDDRRLTNKTFSELFIINAVTTLVSTVLYCALIFSRLGASFDRKLAICFGVSVLFNLINIDWLYKGEEEYVYIACRSIFIKAVALVSVFIFVKTKDDYVNYAIITVLSLGGNYFYNIFHARKYVKITFKGLQFKRHFTPIMVLALSIFLSSIYSKIDITMLGSMSNKTATGLYTNASKISEIVIVACTSISAVFLPRLSYYYKFDREKFMSLITFGVKILLFLSIPAAVAIFILAPQAIELLFGKEFVPGASTLRILAVLIIIKSLGDLLCYQLVICTGNEKQRLPAYVAASVANVVLNALLIPVLNEKGAAIASVVSELIVNAYQFFKMRKIIRIPFSKAALFQALISSAAMGVVVFFITRITLPLIITTAVSVLSGLLVYIALNLIMKNELILMAKDAVNKKIKELW